MFFFSKHYGTQRMGMQSNGALAHLAPPAG